jgi:hypothetical protein
LYLSSRLKSVLAWLTMDATGTSHLRILEVRYGAWMHAFGVYPAFHYLRYLRVPAQRYQSDEQVAVQLPQTLGGARGTHRDG